ncbi:hypothetical protein M9Y10_033744 [Tritrichomonas musculus]|uniref:Uncharacterized protein n=1 Tax=Tritrichomonas musculus TaxID=1915356 RepID=A0ABR2KDN1_9EUKA
MFCILLFIHTSLCHQKIIHEWDSEIINELFKTSKVEHPASIINKKDLERARKNIEKYDWARKRRDSVANSANGIIGRYNDEFLDNMVPRTTPNTHTFCPNCAKLGGFMSKGTWSWHNSKPNEITCSKCGAKFPNNKKYPESISYTSKWDPEQVITYINTGPQICMKYFRCYSSVEGVIRGKKLDYTINRLPTLYEAYALTGDIKYANAVKKFLLKLADRMPYYMVYMGYSYSQYADCDPHYVVQNLPNLPIINGHQCPMIAADSDQYDDKAFFSNYWSASRLGTSGTDGEYVQIFAQAYDMIADALKDDGKPLLSEEEKNHIEKDLLIESCLLGYFDKKINNKSTMNLKGCALVGLVVGNAKLVHFGIDGFNRTLSEYYLKDGSTSQSQGYGIKTLNGLSGLNLAFRNYSDPPNFVPGENEQILKNFNINHDTEFEPIWHALMWAVNSDFYYPIIGDETFKVTFPTSYDYLVSEYKRKYMLEYVGMLQSEGINYSPNLYLSDPDYVPYNGTVKLPDFVYPYLQQGYIRSGKDGRESILILDASPADGGHHHLDSLNIIYTKYNKEMLLDLGYLVDHPNGSFTQATVAHQTCLFDGIDQQLNNRGGQFHLFDATNEDTKVMQASSRPYSTADVYQRTLLQMKHDKNDYVVDIFRAKGGKKRRELVIHGPNNDYQMNKKLSFNDPYEVVPAPSSIEFRIRSIMKFEIADFSLYETNEDGSQGDEILRDLNLESTGNGECKDDVFICYNKNAKTDVSYSLVDGPTKGKKAVQIEVTKGNNCNLLIGHSKKYLPLKENARYILQFKARGKNFVDRIRLKYSNVENEYKKLSLNDIKENEWTLFKGYFDIGKPFSEALGTITNDPVSIEWKIDENTNFSIFAPSRPNQKVFFKNGWGQRKTGNADIGATLPYFYFYRDIEDKVSTWVTVYEGYKDGHRLVESVEARDDDHGNVEIKVKTTDGCDLITSSFEGKEVASSFGLKSNAKIAVINNGKPRLFDGNFLEFNGQQINRKVSTYNGTVLGIGITETKDKSWFDIDDSVDINKVRPGQILFVQGDDKVSRGYPILRTEKVAKAGYRVYVKYDYKGFKSHPANTYHIMNVISEFDSPDKPTTTTTTKISSSLPDEYLSDLSEIWGNESDSGFNETDNEDKQKENKKKRLSTAGIVGIVFAVIAVIAAVVGGSIFIIRRSRKQSSESGFDVYSNNQI